jgi:hypothetical protein
MHAAAAEPAAAEEAVAVDHLVRLRRGVVSTALRLGFTHGCIVASAAALLRIQPLGLVNFWL